jgi:hypothetical protein
MTGHAVLVKDMLIERGVPPEDIAIQAKGHGGTAVPTWVGPSKEWDVVVYRNRDREHLDREIVALLEFKSQVGSIGNNQTNRLDEAVGCAANIRLHHRMGNLAPVDKRIWMGYCLLCCPGDDEIAPTTRLKQPIMPVDNVWLSKASMDASENERSARSIEGLDYLARYGVALSRLENNELYDKVGFMQTCSSTILGRSVYLQPFPELSVEKMVGSLVKHVTAEYGICA